MNKKLMSLADTTRAIQDGSRLIVSADENFLNRLPRGQWIGGTSPYSMSERGGSCDNDWAYVQELPPESKGLRTVFYNKDTIKNVYSDGKSTGFGVILVPAFTDVLVKFALDVSRFTNFAGQPLIGWVTGARLEDLGKIKPKVYDGVTGKSSTDEALVMHVNLPDNKYADLGIINIFEADEKGDVLRFESDAWEIKEVTVDGKKMNFADYVTEKKIDIRWPLTSNYHGAFVNSSFASVDTNTHSVKFLAPLFKGIDYHLARPAGTYQNYLEAFRRHMPDIDPEDIALTCNCVLNYKYGDLDGKNLDELNGPFVFGEIAYQLLNQTLVYLQIEDR